MSVPPEYQCATHPDRYEPCVSCDWLHIRKDRAAQWSDDDLRAMSNVLGSQLMVVHLPQVSTVPWCSTDEQAGFTVNDAGELVIRTTGPISPYTAAELASALTAYRAHYQQQPTENAKGT